MGIHFKNQFYPIKSKSKATEKLPRKQIQPLSSQKNGKRA